MSAVSNHNQSGAWPGGDGAAQASGRGCVFCGRCLAVCPMFGLTGREELSPKAKFALFKELPGLDPQKAAKLAGLCFGCGRCEAACPQGVSGKEMVAAARAAFPGWQANILELLLKHAELLPLWLGAAKLFSGGGETGPDAGRVSLWLDSFKALRPLDAGESWLELKNIAPCASRNKAVIFAGCVAAHVAGQRLEKAESIAGLAGLELRQAQDFGCCGGALGLAGLPEAELACAVANLKAWRELGRPAVLVFCASCLYYLRAYARFANIFAPGESALWLERLTPLAALLEASQNDILPGAPEVAHYHQPCHAAEPDCDLLFLRQALGPRLAHNPGKDACCGFGGVLKLLAPELSARAGGNCRQRYGAKASIVTGCSGCATQLKAAHWLDILRI